MSNPLLPLLPPPTAASPEAAAAAAAAAADADAAAALDAAPLAPAAAASSGEAGLPPSDFSVLRNKAPRWHEAYQCWCLDFGGRVTQASVKNFQLCSADAPSRVLMQFGRTSHADLFVCDFEHPLSAVQAFAVCLSAFDSKLACR